MFKQIVEAQGQKERLFTIHMFYILNIAKKIIILLSKAAHTVARNIFVIKSVTITNSFNISVMNHTFTDTDLIQYVQL